MSSIAIVRSSFLSFVLVFGFVRSANAQQTFGSIIETVTDASGSATFEVNTNETGQYTKGQVTDGTDVAQKSTSQPISELPRVGGNLQAFELLNPGTSKTMFGRASDENPQGSVQSYTDGLPFFMTGYYLDGTVSRDPILDIIVIW